MINTKATGLEITTGQRTMSGQIEELSGQTLALPVILTGHINFDSVAINNVQKKSYCWMHLYTDERR